MSQSDKPAEPRTYRLKLYVVGETANSLRALENLKRICDEELADRYDLEVIDVLVSPQLADEDKIVAIPTLIKELPQPLRKVVGDLSDREQVLLGLDLVATGEGE